MGARDLNSGPCAYPVGTYLLSHSSPLDPSKMFKNFLWNLYPISGKLPDYVTENKGTDYSQRGLLLLVSHSRLCFNSLKLSLRWNLNYLKVCRLVEIFCTSRFASIWLKICKICNKKVNLKLGSKNIYRYIILKGNVWFAFILAAVPTWEWQSAIFIGLERMDLSGNFTPILIKTDYMV